MVKLNINKSYNLSIKGGYYTNSTTVEVDNCVVNSVSLMSSDEIIVNITTSDQEGYCDFRVTNESGTTTFSLGAEIKRSTWKDLRQGADEFNTGTDITMRSGMTVERDSNGMYFNGGNPWNSWVKFNSLLWNRTDNYTCQIIFTRPDSFMMVGIGSVNTNETNSAQYSQAEIQAYFNGNNNFWGLYGNTGAIGTAGNQSFPINISGGSGVFKIKFTKSGSRGGEFSLYSIPSSSESDWDDESNLLGTIEIGGTLNPDEHNIMPFITPRSGGSQRFLAIKVE